jgi:hypothetical protein
MNTSINQVSSMNNGMDIIYQQIEEERLAIHSHAEFSALAFLANLSSKIPSWINGYNCSHHIDNIFKLKHQVTDYTEELVSYLQDDIRKETQDWVEEQFIPLVEREIITLSQAVDSEVDAKSNQLNELSISVDINKRAIVNSTTPSKGNRILSTGASILMGDLGGAIMGGAGGVDAMLKTLGCEFGAGIILGIISTFNPVGFGAIVVSAVISAFVGGSWALSSVEKKIRKTLIEKCREMINSTQRKEEILEIIHTKIDSNLDKIKEEVNCDVRQCS